MKIFSKCLIFFIFLYGSTFIMSYLFTTPTITRYRLKDFKNDKYNIVILGQSFGKSNVSPFELTEANTDKAFNFAQGGMQLNTIYHFLQELNTYNPLKRVYLDLYYLYWMDDIETFPLYTTLACLSGSRKINFFLSECLRSDYNSFLFPYKLYHITLERIKKNINLRRINTDSLSAMQAIISLSDDDDFLYKGQGFFYCIRRNYYDYPYPNFSEDSITKKSLEAFSKITNYCHNNGIELICYISPLPIKRLKSGNHNKVHEFYTNLCQKHSVQLLDMNYLKYKYLPRSPNDYQDCDGHMMGFFAERFSKLLREIADSKHRDQYFEKNYSDVLDGINNI